MLIVAKLSYTFAFTTSLRLTFVALVEQSSVYDTIETSAGAIESFERLKKMEKMHCGLNLMVIPILYFAIFGFWLKSFLLD